MESVRPEGLTAPDDAVVGAVDISALAAQAADSAMSGINSLAPNGRNSNASSNTANQVEQAAGGPMPDIDFSSAPADPTELALWVAKQISNFQAAKSNSPDPEADAEEEERRRIWMHPPAASTRRFDDDNDPVKVAERERVREENRERKKRWRESNSERNKDNDLRCRINKRAKKLFGVGLSREKSAWMEAEFNKRRAKRETKERIKFDGGLFPGFSFAPGFQNTLFPAPGEGPQGETNAAGLLLANALLGVGNSNDGSSAEAASALKAALEAGTLDPKPFTEALRAMASNPEIMNGIHAILGTGSSGYDDGDDAVSGDEAGNPISQPGDDNNPAESIKPSVEAEDESAEIIKALNAATAIINEMNEGMHQDGGPPENRGSSVVDRANLHQANGAVSALEENNNDGNGLNQEQVNALLALANGGGALGDTKNSLDNDAHATQPEERRTPPQPDNDITATLQRIVQQLVEEKDTQENGQGQPLATAVNSFAQSATGLEGFRSPTDAIQSLLQTSGVAVNTIIPAAQSQATSKFYARLSARSSLSVGGGINPAHANAFGNTTGLTRKLLARPDAFQKPSSDSSHVPGLAPSKPKDPERLKKISTFGFPPLPGSRPGALKRKAQ